MKTTGLIGLLLFSCLGIALAQPGIVRSDGTFSINSLGNSSANLIVPQNLILSKTGTTPVNVMNSISSYNTKLRNAEHLKLFNWEALKYDTSTQGSITWATLAEVNTSCNFVFFAEKSSSVTVGDQVYTLDKSTGKLSYLQILDPAPVKADMKTFRFTYFTFNNSHYVARANFEQEGALGNPSKIYKLSSNAWTEYQAFPKSVVSYAFDIEYCFPPNAPSPFLAVSTQNNGLILHKVNSSQYWNNVTTLSTAYHTDSHCLYGNNIAYYAAFDNTATQLVLYKYKPGADVFEFSGSVTMPSWASATAVMASIKYNNPTSGVDWFYITICQQGTGSSFVTRYIPNQNSVTVIQTITTASECSDVDTFTIDNTNYMIVGSSLSSTQALYRWNQAVEEWDLLTTVSVQTGTSSHLVYKDSNNVAWVIECNNLLSSVTGYTLYKLI